MSSFYDGSGVGSYGAGDDQQMYNATTAQLLSVKDGTTAAPDTSLNPLVKVERTLSIAESAITGDGVEQSAAILAVAVGTSTCEVMPVGVAGMAKNSYPSAATYDDACGLYGVGRITGSGEGVGIGAYLAGRTDSSSGKATAVEANVYNGTGSNHSVSTTAFPASSGLWVNANGPNRCAAGIALGNAFGAQFDVGLHFNAQVTSALTGPTLTNDIRTDSTSTTSVYLNGTHTNALVVGSSAGKSIFGATSGSFASAKVEVQVTGSSDPAFAVVGDNITSAAIANGSGNGRWFVSAGADNVLTGTVAGDTGMKAQTSGKAFHIGGTTSVIKVTNGNALGFFNATAVAKQTISGSRATDTWRQSVMAALVAYGLVTDSSSA